jgi:hypothetical protein
VAESEPPDRSNFVEDLSWPGTDSTVTVNLISQLVGPPELSAGPSLHELVGLNWTSPVVASTALTLNVTPAQAATPVPEETTWNTPGSGSLHVGPADAHDGVCEIFETLIGSATFIPSEALLMVSDAWKVSPTCTGPAG